MPALSNAYWSELCAASFDGRTVPEFQRTLLAVGGTTVRAMFGPANFALILWPLQCSCMRSTVLPPHPHHHASTRSNFTLIQPATHHLTPLPSTSGLYLLLHRLYFPHQFRPLPAHELRCPSAHGCVGLFRNIQVRVTFHKHLTHWQFQTLPASPCNQAFAWMPHCVRCAPR